MAGQRDSRLSRRDGATEGDDRVSRRDGGTEGDERVNRKDRSRDDRDIKRREKLMKVSFVCQ